MAEFAATQNTGTLTKFIQGIPQRGIPPKITIEHLTSLGFKSTNDRSVVTVLKFVGLGESDGRPSEPYKQMRNREIGGKVLASLIRKSYADLFTVYPDAQTKDVNALQNYFASKTDVGAASLKNIVKTFHALCSCADFSGQGTPVLVPVTEHVEPHGKILPGSHQPQRHLSKAEVHFDIQIHLPGDQKPEVYESIFKHLGKYVLGIRDE